jgi:hypothetical protein
LVDLGGRIEVGGELTTLRRPFQREVVAPALFVQVSGPQGNGELGVVLSVAEQGLEHRTRVGPHEEIGQLVEVHAQLAVQVAVVGGRQRFGRVLEEGVQQDVGFGAPPAVDGLLGDAGTGGDALDGDAGEPLLDKQIIGGLQNRLPGVLTAPVPVAVVAPRSRVRAGYTGYTGRRMSSRTAWRSAVASERRGCGFLLAGSRVWR